MLWIHQRFPNDNAICPRPAPSWLPSIMSTALLFEHQAPTGSHAASQTRFFRFSCWLGRFISEHHGSGSANKLTSGPGTALCIQTKWSIWSVWMLPWLPAYSVFSRWRFRQYLTFQIPPVAHHTEGTRVLAWDVDSCSSVHLRLTVTDVIEASPLLLRPPVAAFDGRTVMATHTRPSRGLTWTDCRCPKRKMASN